jgi:hypothetical protein
VSLGMCPGGAARVRPDLRRIHCSDKAIFWGKHRGAQLQCEAESPVEVMPSVRAESPVYRLP